jgi:hypothetical protein
MRRPGRKPSPPAAPDPWRVADPPVGAGESSVPQASPHGSRISEAPRQLSRQVTDLVRRLSGPDDDTHDTHDTHDTDPATGEAWPDGASGRKSSRVRQIGQLTAALAQSARGAGVRAVTSGGWLAELVEEIAPHVTVRDLATLEQAYGCRGDALADAVVKSASHTTAGIGAAAGALAAAELAAPPTLLATPVQLAAETLSVVAVELRMVGELHEVYGLPLTGSPRSRASALLVAWVRRRALESGGGPLLLGAAARRELRKRVLRRLGGSVTTLAPFLAGAVAGAEVNRRETRKLGESVSSDLRDRAVAAFPAHRVVDALPAGSPGRGHSHTAG